jgi:hypothetical protein
MGGPTHLWKCQACEGWFDLGRGLDQERPVPTASECSCPNPDIQHPFAEVIALATTGTSHDVAPLDAIDRVLHACQSIRDEASRTERVTSELARAYC